MVNLTETMAVEWASFGVRVNAAAAHLDPKVNDANGHRSLLAVAGVARPQRFFGMLAELGLQVDTLALPDHADFSALPWATDVAGIVLTEKDAVKLTPDRVGALPVWVVALDFAPGAGFEAALDRQLQSLSFRA